MQSNFARGCNTTTAEPTFGRSRALGGALSLTRPHLINKLKWAPSETPSRFFIEGGSLISNLLIDRDAWQYYYIKQVLVLVLLVL